MDSRDQQATIPARLRWLADYLENEADHTRLSRHGAALALRILATELFPEVTHP